jgi:poly-beta-1,6-N-acetyl-D-glucosamine synthase
VLYLHLYITVMLNNIIIYVFISSLLTQMIYWLWVFGRVAFYKEKKLKPQTPNPKSAPPSVSVIICARNEAENLQNNLPSILNQTYPRFEVIIVNDASDDDTPSVLESFSEKYPYLRIITLTEKKLKGKKGALAEGIKAAQYDWVLLTDADCYPLSTEWIAAMMTVTEDKEMGLGFSPYEKCDGFLNVFIRYEAVFTAVQYMGFALVGEPYMGVGRNLIYRKSLFQRVGGFDSHAHIASGDDDLFVNQVVTKNNFKIFLDPKTFTYSKPKTQWNDYITQKRRHYTTAFHYKWKHKILLGGISVSHFFYSVTALLALILKISTIFVLVCIVVRIVVVWFLYGKILRKLRHTDLFWWIPLLDAVYVLFYVLFAPALFIRTQKWR